MKPRMLYLIGAPGVGKSTVMDEIVDQLGLEWEPDVRVWRELWVNPLYRFGEVPHPALSLGKRRPGFAGTDALSMSASPQVVKWLAQANLPPMLFGEGARLGSPKFLAQADRYVDVTLVLLYAGDDVLEARCVDKPNLSETYRRGRKSSAATCAVGCDALGIPVLTEDTSFRTPGDIASSILNGWR